MCARRRRSETDPSYATDEGLCTEYVKRPRPSQRTRTNECSYWWSQYHRSVHSCNFSFEILVVLYI